MPLPDDPCLTGELFENCGALSVGDLRRMFALEEQRIAEWVEEGVIDVLEVDAAEWRFGAGQLRRARIALRLERDLGVNTAGAALALELLEELEQLRRHLRTGRS